MSPWYEGIEQRVVEAYQRRGLDAIGFDFRGIDAYGAPLGCCCALGALYNDKYDSIQAACNDGVSSLAESYQFTSGFDSVMRHHIEGWDQRPIPYEAAGAAGHRTALAVINAGIRVR